jgi:Leucine-rich repeat (LRR) protein
MEKTIRRRRPILAVTLALTTVLYLVPGKLDAAENFHPTPQYTYGSSFVSLCQGEQWFIDQIETLLNAEQKSINTIQSQNDLSHIVALGYHNGAQRLPEAVGELKSLRALYLADNRLTSIPAALYTLPALEIIDFSHNQLSGSIPAGFNVSNFPQLKVLLLWDNQYSGSIPAALYDFPLLENLDISYNRLTGAISSNVGQLTHLKLLDAGANRLSGEIPPAFASCGALKALLLYNNQFSGSIPDVFGSLSQLEILDVAVNGLTGPLPAYLPVSLVKLAARDNRLTGSIPYAYGDLVNLHTLDLYHNQLSGNIPASLVNLSKMVKLDLSDNRLDGLLPDIFPHMTDLELAILSDNKLVGHIPHSLVQRQSGGAYVNIAHNYLTGAEARSILVNLDNFIDGAVSTQNRMYLEDYIQILENQELNIYSRFVTREAADTRLLTAKEKLPPAGYQLEITLTAAETAALLDHYDVSAISELVALRSDAAGLYIRVVKALETAYPVTFSLSILRNDGSIYSRTQFRVASMPAPVAAPGGGGGGGVMIWPPLEEKPPQVVAVNPVVPVVSPTAPLKQTIQIISGYPDDTVRPDGQLTREEAARILFNLQAPELPFPYNGQYRDVGKDRWSASALGHLSVLGLVRGYPDGLFRPDQPITRAEFVTLLRGYFPAEEPLDPEDEPVFTDIAGHWAQGYIHAAYLNGVVQGYPDGLFRPNQPITRAEAVTVFLNLSGRWPNVTLSNPFADLGPEHWAYGAILEAYRGETYQPPEWVGVKPEPDETEDEAAEDLTDAEPAEAAEDDDETDEADEEKEPAQTAETGGEAE